MCVWSFPNSTNNNNISNEWKEKLQMKTKTIFWCFFFFITSIEQQLNMKTFPIPPANKTKRKSATKISQNEQWTDTHKIRNESKIKFKKRKHFSLVGLPKLKKNPTTDVYNCKKILCSSALLQQLQLNHLNFMNTWQRRGGSGEGDSNATDPLWASLVHWMFQP